jgi:hypothetical protein
MAYTTIDKPTDYFNTVLYTGNSSTQSITGVGFQPDWVWCKGRSGAHAPHIYDSVRGEGLRLRSDSNDAEADYTATNIGLNSFDSDGFSIGNSGTLNNSGDTYVGWSWLGGGTASSNTDGSVTSNVSANTTSGFSICTFTATGSSMTFGHGLGVAPNLVIWKRRDSSTNGDWATSSDPQGWTNYMTLNNTTANQSGSTRFGSAPTSSVVTVGSETVSGGTYVAYCFASIKGYSKIGSYTGNGNADGPFVYTGFKPAWLMIKTTDTANDWRMFDVKRQTFNPHGKYLEANTIDAESDSAHLDIVSNGFKIRADFGAINISGDNHIYMAFAENPFVTNTGIPTTAR